MTTPRRLPLRAGAAVLLAVLGLVAPAAADPPRPADARRVERLVARMTPAEKASMVHAVPDPACVAVPGACWAKRWYVGGVPRLGVPRLRFIDGPAGPHVNRPATAMPAPIALAATFDPDSAYAYGATMAEETRALGQHVLLAPMVNLVRVPSAGRNFETLGEDPELAAQLGAAEVRGIQDQGVIAVVKHFAANNFEAAREIVEVRVAERALMEGEMLPFRAAVAAGVGGVMCAYPRVLGAFACSNEPLLRDILKRRWNFRGFVRSDLGAAHALTDLAAGVDLEIPPDAFFRDDQILAALEHGTPGIPAPTWRRALDDAVRRILRQMDRFRLLGGEPPRGRSMTALRRPHAAVAERIAADGATLLRNERGVLPLRGRDLRRGRVLVTGPAAAAPVVGGGGTSFVVPWPLAASPLAALRSRSGAPDAFAWAPGIDVDGTLVTAADAVADAAGTRGFLRRQITTIRVPPGQEPVPQPGGAPDRIDPAVDYTGAAALPPESVWRWTATLAPPGPGDYELKVQVRGQVAARLFVDGIAPEQRRVVLGPFRRATFDALPLSRRTQDPPGLQQATAVVRFEAGQSHTIDLRASAGRRPLEVRLAWIPPGWQEQQIAAAAQAATSARKAVVVAYDTSSEERDRPRSLALPGLQDELIAAVAAANRNTVVVLDTGGPVVMPWLEDVAGVLQAWYPGQRGGAATAGALLGRADPGGRLPVSFPTSPRRQPTWSPDGRRYPGIVPPGGAWPVVFYDEGVFGGYKWYERTRTRPLFAFGHGLSYTTFAYDDLAVTAGRSGGCAVAFTVRNTGRRPGTDVPQVYLGRPAGAPVPMPRKALAGFRRVRLGPGEQARVRVRIAPAALRVWSEDDHDWRTPPGRRAVLVGASSADVRLRGRTPPVSAPPAAGRAPAAGRSARAAAASAPGR